MTEEKHEVVDPFLFRFVEEDKAVDKSQGATNPKEDEPSPEPTTKGPWGD